MRKLRIGILDLVSRGPNKTLWNRIMAANLASIMPQIVAVWCEEAGHEVTFACYTGREDIETMLPDNMDLVFIGAFTEAAQTSYALSNYYRSTGAVTVLGGPHARCYPQDALLYFDYVTGFTDRGVIDSILSDCSPHRDKGMFVTAPQQPLQLPGVRERWKFIDAVLAKAPFVQIVPMIGSLGCPYTCSFCIDAEVPYQPLDFEVLKDDLRFLLTKFKRPLVGWHDPNFGIRFNDYMNAIEEAIPPNSIDFVAETSLALLNENHVQRLSRNGFKGMLPGIESWYELGNKSATGQRSGLDKVKEVSEHVNMILRYIPYVQTNFVLGLDSDEGPEPFELTKRFVEMTPAAFPGYSLLTAFGQAAPLNLQLQREQRLLSFPFHFLDNNRAINVKPKHYTWEEFYTNIIGLVAHTFSLKSIGRRLQATKGFIPKWLNVVRALSSEGKGRLHYHQEILRRLQNDSEFMPFFSQMSSQLPAFYYQLARKDLGSLWNYLPENALHHDPYAYLKTKMLEPVMPTTEKAAATY